MKDIIPYEVNEHYNKIIVDKSFHSYWILKRINNDVSMFKGMSTVLNIPNICLSMHINKLNSGELLKKLTKVISQTKSEKESGLGDQVDIDILNKTVEDARQLRYMMQVQNEDVYEVSMVFSILGSNKEELIKKEKELENIAYTNGFLLVPANFRQKQAYFSTLPTRTCLLPNINLYTTSSLSSMFPFYTQTFTQLEGICLGKNKNNACLIDFRNNYNNNKNILVFGSSGAGKSYCIKLMILQYLYIGVKQIVIDPEGEYAQIAKRLNQRVITKNNYNVFEIEEGFVMMHTEDFLELKINQLCQIFHINNILQDKNKQQVIRDLIREVYKDNYITDDIHSLYVNSVNETIYSNKQYLNFSKFPKIHELKGKIKNCKLNATDKKHILSKINKFEDNNLLYSNVEQDLIVYDLSQKNDVYLEFIIEKLKEYCAPNVYIYIDEIWQIISSRLQEPAMTILEMFKTIRKTGAGIVAITQDITDILLYNNGDFGKTILNNAFTKIYFKMEFLDIENLERLIINKNNIIGGIKQLKRGNAIVDYGGNTFELEIQASDFENKLIEGDII